MVNARYNQIRSIMETPILDEHKWSKVPDIRADAFLLDLEDSVPPDAKQNAREKVISFLGAREYFGGRTPIARVNALNTPWGHADLGALGEAGATAVAYPKVRTAEELREVQALLRASGADPDLFVVIETAQAVLEVGQIAKVDRMAGLLFGPSDLAFDAGFELFDGDKLANRPLAYPRAAITLAGAAHGLRTFDIPFVTDLHDLNAVRAQAVDARRTGFTGMATFYPPHVDIINDVFSTSPSEFAAAKRVASLYENALANGKAAVIVDGKALIIQDYKRAKAVIERATAEGSQG